ncbi:MAG: hypothetical protein HKN43_13250 [Rhodothermales bacterium]|nr:hypothetical protein [Rhodothermales bacterium]
MMVLQGDVLGAGGELACLRNCDRTSIILEHFAVDFRLGHIYVEYATDFYDEVHKGDDLTHCLTERYVLRFGRTKRDLGL